MVLYEFDEERPFDFSVGISLLYIFASIIVLFVQKVCM